MNKKHTRDEPIINVTICGVALTRKQTDTNTYIRARYRFAWFIMMLTTMLFSIRRSETRGRDGGELQLARSTSPGS